MPTVVGACITAAMSTDEETPPAETQGFRSILRALGPGLITGAADDDPSGIGTHSQVGAEFGYGLAWTFVLSFPLMVVIQEIAAKIGRVTGAGIARNLRRHYPRFVLYFMISLLLVANVVNLGADLSAMGAALALLVGGTLFGITGMIFAIPEAAILKGLFVYYYERHSERQITTEDGALFKTPACDSDDESDTTCEPDEDDSPKD